MKRKLLRLWRRFRRRAFAQMFRRRNNSQQPAGMGPGLFLTRKDRERAKSADEFWQEFDLHRKLDAERDARNDSWLNPRRKNR
jgi:hypothetical protein